MSANKRPCPFALHWLSHLFCLPNKDRLAICRRNRSPPTSLRRCSFGHVTTLRQHNSPGIPPITAERIKKGGITDDNGDGDGDDDNDNNNNNSNNNHNNNNKNNCLLPLFLMLWSASVDILKSSGGRY
ncbi:unnamed protein product [Polarella glacialis]|uniref:Uncharacterized protein n=1 Tax=Polarella glacialis TaxID=89957 RepID=A0A813IGT4_POLGL|nr:unnamed protein product [Polarella glacialis]CAE8655690.1 unnamed protein product [Polarella glacialis]